MTLLNHWHPTIKSSQLKRKPVLVELCSEEIVLFRSATGNIAALKNRCPHRGMRLSEGWVENEEIVCPYHAWRYAADGQGFSPSTPKLKPCASSFTVVERYGVIWVKAANSSAEFPDFNGQNNVYAGVVIQDVQAPLEAVVDNFSDIEHSPTTHTYFGYSYESLAKIESHIETTDKTVRVTNKAVQQPLPWIVEKLFFNVHSGDEFANDWTTYFSPMYSTYDQSWVNPATGESRRIRVRLAVFYVPISDDETRVMIFVFANPIVNKAIFQLLVGPMVRFIVNYELKKDRDILENLADKQMTLSEMQLGRYDRVLGETRKRIDRLYRGQTQKPDAEKQMQKLKVIRPTIKNRS
ncbi:MAG: aromatic ring-hydroxylating dioxygenase subunit alpha [Cyanobacteria bacterium J06632_3]